MKKILLFLALGSFILACNEDTTSEIETAQLAGKWQLKTASRNGKMTNTLDDLYFTFSSEGKMETNMPTMEGTSDYSINGVQIEQRSTNIENDYLIESISDSTLILTTKIQNFDFRFVLDKSTE